MCVLVIKQRGASLPTRKELVAMAKANPDGFGFVSESAFYKTLDFEDFYNHLKKVPKRENCIIHLRWATHGSVKVENCHPFNEDGFYFAHNGVLPIESKNDKTDSEICFREKIMPHVREVGLKNATPYINFIKGSSRFAIMCKGHVYTYGSFTPWHGCLYSNLRFLAYLDEPRHYRMASCF